VIPATDPGRWDVYVDSSRVLTAAGDGASAGPIGVSAGNHIIQALGRQFSKNYSTQILCSDGSITTHSYLQVYVASGTALSCTITERRRLRKI
jgi:hypothetical protein